MRDKKPNPVKATCRCGHPDCPHPAPIVEPERCGCHHASPPCAGWDQHGLPGEEYPLSRSVQRRIEAQEEACPQCDLSPLTCTCEPERATPWVACDRGCGGDPEMCNCWSYRAHIVEPEQPTCGIAGCTGGHYPQDHNEVAALREQVTELELERIDVNALRTSCICDKECPATEHEYPPIEEDEVSSGLRAGRDAETRRADDNYDAMKRAEAERDKERQINDYLVKRTNELEAERDELLSRAREMDDAIARNMLRGDIAEAERDRYRAALEDARHVATTGVWDCGPAHCYEDQIIEAIASVIDTALDGSDDE